jgi:hypothetical protein
MYRKILAAMDEMQREANQTKAMGPPTKISTTDTDGWPCDGVNGATKPKT